MTFYAGLDVSDKSTHICLVDEAGAIVWRGTCITVTVSVVSGKTSAGSV